MIALFAAYIAVGAVAGILAGMFGVGGGLVIVPMLVFVMGRHGVARESIMHLALGTSMASIIFTSVSSFLAHHRRGAVDWTIARSVAPGIIAGTFLGSLLAAHVSTRVLKVFFIIFVYSIAVQMLVDRAPKPSRNLPGRAGMFAAGVLIGMVSSLVGIGGGALSVPFLIWCNVAVRRAVGTSAAIGFPIALSGAIWYIINGWNAAGLPPFALGHVYLPALAGIVVASIPAAHLGARLAHALPAPMLKRALSVVLILIGTRMLAGVL